MPMTVHQAVPVLPTSDLDGAIAVLAGPFGFELVSRYDAYALLGRDGAQIHLFACTEPKIASWTSCRLHLTGIAELYAACQAAGVVHPNGPLVTKEWGAQEFTALLPGGAALNCAEYEAEA